MKKFIVLVALFVASTLGASVHAQVSTSDTRDNPKAQREAERSRQKAKAEAQEAALYAAAVQALKENRFVVEVDRVVFKYGDVAYVNTNTNFILVDEDEGSVQVAFNTPYSGPNGIGGVTVDGRVSGIKLKESKKGKINYNFSVQGTGISAQIFLTLSAGSNQATVTITPNFNSRTLTLYGEIVPLEQSSVFKGRSL